VRAYLVQEVQSVSYPQPSVWRSIGTTSNRDSIRVAHDCLRKKKKVQVQTMGDNRLCCPVRFIDKFAFRARQPISAQGVREGQGPRRLEVRGMTGSSAKEVFEGRTGRLEGEGASSPPTFVHADPRDVPRRNSGHQLKGRGAVSRTSFSFSAALRSGRRRPKVLTEPPWPGRWTIWVGSKENVPPGPPVPARAPASASHQGKAEVRSQRPAIKRSPPRPRGRPRRRSCPQLENRSEHRE